MSLEKMRNWTRCVVIAGGGGNVVIAGGGNVVNWATTEWRMYGLKEENMTTEHVCPPQTENRLSVFTFPLKTLGVIPRKEINQRN